MILTCKCLNITVEAKESGNDEVDLPSRGLSSSEEFEHFFKEDLKKVQLTSVTKKIAPLVQRRSVGDWMVERCLNCLTYCYATNIHNSYALINASLITSTVAINKLERGKDFSPVFRVIIQPDFDEKDIASLRQSSAVEENVFTSLQKQLREAVREEVTKTEERIQCFNEGEYAKLRDFQNRATNDHKILARKIYQIHVPSDGQGGMPLSNDETESRRVEHTEPTTNRRQITSKKSEPITATLAHENEFKGRRTVGRPIRSYTRIHGKVAGSLDTEGLFVLEGMEGNVKKEAGHSEGESDTDHEDSGSHDEGIDVHRKRTPSFQLAKSLPVNVPVYSIAPAGFDRFDDAGDSVDIAASIKALARSVHGDTVFGDLPRPRFSTQI